MTDQVDPPTSRANTTAAIRRGGTARKRSWRRRRVAARGDSGPEGRESLASGLDSVVKENSVGSDTQVAEPYLDTALASDFFSGLFFGSDFLSEEDEEDGESELEDGGLVFFFGAAESFL